MRQDSPVLFLESFTSGVMQGISQRVLCCFGPSWKAGTEVHAPCSGNSSGRCCSGAEAQGAPDPCSARGSEQAGCHGGILFRGAMRAAHQCSFPFWCSGAVTPREAEEVTFWPSFCLSYLAEASQIQLGVSQHLRVQGWIVGSAQCTYPPVSTLSSPGTQGRLDLPGSTS